MVAFAFDLGSLVGEKAARTYPNFDTEGIEMTDTQGFFLAMEGLMITFALWGIFFKMPWR